MKWSVYCVLSILLLVSPVAALATDSGKETQSEEADGWKSALEESGISLEIAYTGEVLNKIRGGFNHENGSSMRHDITISAGIDSSVFGLPEGGSLSVAFQVQRGDALTEDYVGDYMVLSNMDAHDFHQISDFSYTQEFQSLPMWIRVGIQDANDSFAAPQYGGEFINSAAGFSPTIPLVTYPYPDFGVTVGFEFTEYLSMNTGVYRGRGRCKHRLHGVMAMAEPSLNYAINGMEGHFRIGIWHTRAPVYDIRTMEEIVGLTGWYAHWDQFIYKEYADEDDEQGIGISLQYGSTPEENCKGNVYMGLTTTWTGMLPTRDEDIIGLGIYRVDFSKYALEFEREYEMQIEAFYKVQILPMMAIKGDVHYITNPGGMAVDNALVAGGRLEIVF